MVSPGALNMNWLWRWSLAIGGVAAASGLAVLWRVLERYENAGTVNWANAFQALMVPIVTFCVVRFVERQMVETGCGPDAAVDAPGQQQIEKRRELF